MEGTLNLYAVMELPGGRSIAMKPGPNGTYRIRILQDRRSIAPVFECRPRELSFNTWLLSFKRNGLEISTTGLGSDITISYLGEVFAVIFPGSWSALQSVTNTIRRGETEASQEIFDRAHLRIWRVGYK